jgi:DNA-binding NarL/FixJ family response regulator
MYTRHDLVMAVKELLERHWDVTEIALKLHIDVETIKNIVDLLT